LSHDRGVCRPSLGLRESRTRKESLPRWVKARVPAETAPARGRWRACSSLRLSNTEQETSWPTNQRRTCHCLPEPRGTPYLISISISGSIQASASRQLSFGSCRTILFLVPHNKHTNQPSIMGPVCSMSVAYLLNQLTHSQRSTALPSAQVLHHHLVHISHSPTLIQLPDRKRSRTASQLLLRNV
jgi:hypothetical protein